MSEQPRILILDIETFPQKQLRWRYFEKGVAFHVLEPNKVAVVSYRWVGEMKKAKAISQSHDPNWIPGVLDDEWLMNEVWDLVVDADFVVAHYGQGFDLPMLQARLLEHRIGPFPPNNWIDSKKEIAKFMRGSGYSMALGNMAEWLELGDKLETNKSLWLRCMDGVKVAWKDMIRYANHDVDLLHDLWLEIGPYIHSMPFNMGQWHLGEDVCTWCGSKDLMSRGYYRTSASVFPRYYCNDCGHWPRGRARLPQKAADGTDVRLR